MELVNGLGYVALTVPDLEASVEFYPGRRTSQGH